MACLLCPDVTLYFNRPHPELGLGNGRSPLHHATTITFPPQNHRASPPVAIRSSSNFGFGSFPILESSFFSSSHLSIVTSPPCNTNISSIAPIVSVTHFNLSPSEHSAVSQQCAQIPPRIQAAISLSPPIAVLSSETEADIDSVDMVVESRNALFSIQPNINGMNEENSNKFIAVGRSRLLDSLDESLREKGVLATGLLSDISEIKNQKQVTFSSPVQG